MPAICSSCAVRKRFVLIANSWRRNTYAVAAAIWLLCWVLVTSGASEPKTEFRSGAGARQDDRLPAPRALTPEEKKVEQAIERGSAWLTKQRNETLRGRIGETALVGLTLLECGTALYDPLVEAILTRVRGASQGTLETYDVSLSIMFLDRLGREKDSGLIRSLALRLVAAQNNQGGWHYACRHLTAEQEESLFSVLEEGEKQGQQLPEIAQKGQQAGQNEGEKEGQQSPGKAQARQNEARQGAGQPNGAQARGQGNEGGRMPSKGMPAKSPVYDLPVVRFSRGLPAGAVSSTDDNSNTQFATLALWVAKKHNVPVENSLAMVEIRFLRSQNVDGSWGYSQRENTRHDSLTCAGLLGLAVGRAIDKKLDPAVRDAANRVRDKGLLFVNSRVGSVPTRGSIVGAASLGDLYYLWTLERMAVVLDRTEFGGKDWYQWGSRRIVAAQRADGQWRDRWPGMPDTCFALLFLKRANLVSDLTDKLKKPDGQQGPGQTQDPQQRRPQPR